MSFIISEDFQIVTKCKNFNFTLDKALENVPNKDKFYKDLLREECNKLLYKILLVNCGYKNDNNLVIIKAQIALIDYHLDRLYQKKYISENKLYELGDLLMKINKMCIGWIKNMNQHGSKT